MTIQRLALVLLVLVSLTGCKDGAGKISSRDEVEMVRIPMISGYTKVGDPIYQDFYMDVTEVTVGQFKKFLKSSGYEPKKPTDWAELYKYSPTDDHPMIYVSWFDATAYCEWAGKRLPTEAEWEFAARGGLVDKAFPWGDDESIASEYANFADKNADAVLRQQNDVVGDLYKDLGWADMTVDDGYAACAPVGSFRPNGYGLYDMAGNVHEWCQDRYDSDKTMRVFRGGAWSDVLITWHVAERLAHYPTASSEYCGFRCVSGSK